MRVVRQEAQRIQRKFPPSAVEMDDLISHGTIAMLEAERRFDAARGDSLEAYARIRIRGGIIDGIRNGLGTFGRRAYRDFKSRLAAQRPTLQSVEAGQRFTGDASLKVSYNDVADFAKTLLETHPCMPVMDTPEDAFSQAEAIEALRAALSELNTGEVRVVRAIYDFSLDDNSGAKLAMKLGLNRSQICRKHQKILKKLRRRIRLYGAATLSG
jgi:RNA polymerase sigma factor (sigma-70 family)